MADALDDLLTKSEEDLFRLIGGELQDHLAMPKLPRELVADGKKWFQSRTADLRALLCGNKHLRSLDQPSELRDATLLVADVISAHFSGVSPLFVSCLVVKIGIRNICSESK